MSPRILYIDDEVDLVELASSFFEDEGLPIDSCTTFHDALERVRNNKYDLIISDVHMPTGSGHELRSIITKEKLFQGKFILVTGSGSDLENQNDYDLIIYKPLDFQELIIQVKKLLSL
jgi:CheY-like chemotaxis protein